MSRERETMPEPVCVAFRAALAGRALSRAEALALAPFIGSHLRVLLAAAGAVGTAGVAGAAGLPGTASGMAASPGSPGAVDAAGSRPLFSCGIINARSGRCGEDCAFCAQSVHHRTGTPVFGLVSEEELYQRAVRLAEAGVERMGIVSSGARPGPRDFAAVCRAARRIADSVPIELCASLGLLEPEQARQLKAAGITRYHHNLETGRSFFPQICTTHSYEMRVNTVKIAGEAGLRVCSGGIFGLGESWEQRFELFETLQELEVDCIPVNFLIPVPGTPLERAPRITAAEALGLVACLRLMQPGREIVLCGGRARALGEWDRLAVAVGGVGVMVGDYLTAKGSPFERDAVMLRELREIFPGD